MLSTDAVPKAFSKVVGHLAADTVQHGAVMLGSTALPMHMVRTLLVQAEAKARSAAVLFCDLKVYKVVVALGADHTGCSPACGQLVCGPGRVRHGTGTRPEDPLADLLFAFIGSGSLGC